MKYTYTSFLYLSSALVDSNNTSFLLSITYWKDCIARPMCCHVWTYTVSTKHNIINQNQLNRKADPNQIHDLHYVSASSLPWRTHSWSKAEPSLIQSRLKAHILSRRPRFRKQTIKQQLENVSECGGAYRW